MNSARELVTEVTELVSFPDVAVQVNDLLADDVSDAESVGAIIEQDPALTATLLRLANSSMYGATGGVDSVAKAFTRIGSREIQELTLGICATRAFNGVPNDILSVEDFWQHSLLCGAASRIIARRARIRDAGMVFTGGLLHDIGHLVMFHLMPSQSLDALALSRDEMDGEEVHIAEREILGYDHMDVGRLLGELWNWPPALVTCIARHHSPFDHSDCADADVVVHVANSVAVLAELESEDLEDASPIDPRAWERLGLESDCVPELVAEAREAVSGLARVFAT